MTEFCILKLGAKPPDLLASVLRDAGGTVRRLIVNAGYHHAGDAAALDDGPTAALAAARARGAGRIGDLAVDRASGQTWLIGPLGAEPIGGDLCPLIPPRGTRTAADRARLPHIIAAISRAQGAGKAA